MKRRGMTLVEVMVGILLSSIVLGAGYQIWSSARRDMSQGTAQQILQHEVRKALGVMSADFKAMKSGTLQVTADPTGLKARIEFQRYSRKEDASKAQNQQLDTVVYVFDKPRLTRNMNGKGDHILGTSIDALNLSRGGDATNHTVAEMNDGNVDTKMGLNARMDIEIVGIRKIPGFRKNAEFKEKVSVFMREEYYASVNKNRYVAMSELSATSSASIEDQAKDKDEMIQMSGTYDPDALAKLSLAELNSLESKEADALKENLAKMGEVEKAINELDAYESRSWGNLGGLLGRGTDVSAIQKRMAGHDKSSDLEQDITDLQAVIDSYEKQNMKDSFGVDTTTLSSEQFDLHKRAYDLKVKDRSLSKAWELGQKNVKAEDKKPYVSLTANYNPETLTKGQVRDMNGNPVEIKGETDDQFNARVADARLVWEKVQRVDLSWMDDDAGEDRVRVYSAALDLRDLGQAKQAYAKAKEDNETNLASIADAKTGK